MRIDGTTCSIAAGIVAGQASPLMRPVPLLCPAIHGDTGLDGPKGGRQLPLSNRPLMTGKAVNVMYDAICRQHAESTAANPGSVVKVR